MKILKGNASFFLLIFIVLLLVVGVSFSIYQFRSNPAADAIAAAIAANRVINVLFVIEDNKIPVSTYALMYSPVTRRAAIFDIPGNLGLLLTRINRVDRIDRVYDPARITSYQNEIERLLGEDIHFSIVITRENLVSMVDLLDGVEIFIPAPISHIDADEIILFPSGMTVLDGDKASLYTTFILSDEDNEMATSRRQRFFLGFFNRQIQMNENLNNRAMSKMYYSLFRASTNRRSLMYLFNELTNIDTDRTNIQIVGGNLREVSGQMLIVPLWDGNLIKEIVRQTTETLTREIQDQIEHALTVEVLNGTTAVGLAGRTADMLRSFGYDVISTGNADRNNHENTVVIHRSGDENLVRDFAELIRCRNIRSEIFAHDGQEESALIQSVEHRADITLLIGRNFDGRFVVGN
ncbi:MAG: LCP family protein [Treponema sp.]|nr:LCP family protein [Treponema sp.]